MRRPAMVPRLRLRAREPASRSGNGGTPQTCTESCNRTYDGCLDHNAAIPGNDFTLQSSNNAANSIIGGPSSCSDDLRKCLNTCGG